MCVYVDIQKNKRYTSTKKNGGVIPPLKDERLKWIPAKCGKCFECRKEKARDWRIRLTEQRKAEFGYFVTLTFNDEAFKALENEFQIKTKDNENIIATKALRRFLERVRKDTKKSLTHWFVTELGENKDRLHLHGIVYGQRAAEIIKKHWKYGNIFIGAYCNEKSINYMTKYMLKYDEKHPHYTQIVLCSKGIGRNYLTKERIKTIKDKAKRGIQPVYTYRNGSQVSLPKYYKDKALTDEEKSDLWLDILNKGVTYIHGEKVKMDDEYTIYNLRDHYREVGKRCFKDNPKEWNLQKEKRRREKWRKYYLENSYGKANTESSRKRKGDDSCKEIEVKIKESMRLRLNELCFDELMRGAGLARTEAGTNDVNVPF